MSDTKREENIVNAEIEKVDKQKLRKRFSAYAFQLKTISKEKEGGK